MNRKRKLTVRRVRAFVRRNIVGIHTRSGRLFDMVFIGAVFVGVSALIIDSVPEIHEEWGERIVQLEAAIGTVFVVEYIARVWVSARKLRYVFSFWGIIDLLAILPFLFKGFGLAYFRVFRVLRIFSIFKAAKYTHASNVLVESLWDSRRKIGVFVLAVMTLIVVLAFTVHTIEPQTFRTVPDALWWVIVTITTVGYGDIYPVTIAGKFIAAITMLGAFGIIAVPTGIVANEVTNTTNRLNRERACPRCDRPQHEAEANYCARCGERLPPKSNDN